MGKPTLNSEIITIPANVQVEIKARKVKVTGPRGTLNRDFKHLNLEMETLGPEKEGGLNRIRVQKWFGTTRELAAVRSACPHAEHVHWRAAGLQVHHEAGVCPFP